MADDPSQILDRARGRDITEIVQTGLGGWLLALSSSVILGVQQITELLLLPFVLMVDVGEQAVTMMLIEPFSLMPIGVQESAAELSAFGIAALPMAAVIVIVTIIIVMAATSISFTSNVVVGMVAGNRLWDFFFSDAEDETEDGD